MSNFPRNRRPLIMGISMLIGIFGGAPAVPASHSPHSIRSAADVVAQWRQDQHLYIKGDLGLPEKALSDLEQWLDANAPNWTVVLMEDASGESYRSADGRSFSGMDAVEFRLGQRLSVETGFGDSVDSRTGKKNGAYFILFLKERKLSYYGSDAYDDYRLGEDHWIGNLDRPAIAAMRGGGRIIDAAKDTISSIDSKLTQRIQAEKDAKIRARESAKRALEGAEELLTYVQEQEELLIPKSATGDIADGRHLTQWRDELSKARDAFNRGEIAQSGKLATDLQERIRSRLNFLDQYRRANLEIATLEAEVAAFVPHPKSSKAASMANAAKSMIIDTKDSHRRGDSKYVAELNDARSSLNSARSENKVTVARLEEEARSAEFRKQMTYLAAGLIILSVVILLWGLNRRRREWKVKAEELLSSRDREMITRRDALFELLDRTNLVVGSSGGADDGSLEGETLRLAQETVRDVDALFIMSSSVDTIIDKAEVLLKPANPLHWLINMFLTRRYRNAVSLLADKPVAFSPDEPLELIVRGRKQESGTAADRLLGKVEDQPPFSLSFNELMNEFSRRAERALVAVDLLETSWEEITGKLKQLNKLVDSLDQAEARNDSAAVASKGVFSMPSIHDVLIPAVGDGLAGAMKVGRKDPVTAIRSWIPATIGQVEDGLALCNLATNVREQIITILEESRDELRRLGRLPHWIEATLFAYSNEADALASRAAEENVRDDISNLGEDLEQLKNNSIQAVELATQADTTAPQAVADAKKEVAAARRNLARMLGIQVKSLLSEDADIDPSRKLEEATSQITAAQTALDRGGVLAASACLEEADMLVDESKELVRITREEFDSHSEKLEQQRSENIRLLEMQSVTAEILQNLTKKYKSAALTIESEEGNSSYSVSENAQDAESAIKEADHVTNHAKRTHSTGRILEGAAELERAANLHNKAEQLLIEIRDHADLIAKTVKANRRSMDILTLRADSAREAVDNPKIMVPTRALFAKALDALNSAEEFVNPKGKSNPFAAARLVATATSHFDEVDAAVEDDRRSHAEASNSLTDAAAQLEVASKLIVEAKNDRIPDSRKIIEASKTVEELLAHYNKLVPKLDQPHGNWPELDIEADTVNAKAAQQAALLKSELRQASSALAALERASRSVKTATGWRGSMGVRISEQLGLTLLHSAKELLRNGNYQHALQHAGEAAREAAEAVAEAEARVARKRREKRRREEAARRRRRSMLRSSSSFGSSIGRSSSMSRSSGGFSRSSTSRSSFGSGSGTSRSGW